MADDEYPDGSLAAEFQKLDIAKKAFFNALCEALKPLVDYIAKRIDRA